MVTSPFRPAGRSYFSTLPPHLVALMMVGLVMIAALAALISPLSHRLEAKLENAARHSPPQRAASLVTKLGTERTRAPVGTQAHAFAQPQDVAPHAGRPGRSSLVYLTATMPTSASSSSCQGDARSYSVVSGDTPGAIAARAGMDWQALATYNHLANPNLISVAQVICIPGTGTEPPSGQGTTQLSDAWQWTARAYQFGWHVSSTPTVGAIIDLQPWVEGAYGLGHVAVVERVKKLRGCYRQQHELGSRLLAGGEC